MGVRILRSGGVYNGLGIFGQAISIDPTENVVIVTHSAWPQATRREFSRHRNALFAAMTAALRE